jgi:carbon storage regulator
MLVLSRRPGEKLHLGPDITVTVIEITGHRVRLGIEAPEQLAILRGEIAEASLRAPGDLPLTPPEPSL